MQNVAGGADQSCPAQMRNQSLLILLKIILLGHCCTFICQIVCPSLNCLKCYFIKYEIFIQICSVDLFIPEQNPYHFIAQFYLMF